MSLRGTYNVSHGNPDWQYSIDYQETGRTGSNATYRVSMKVRMTHSSSRFGYGISASCYINGSGYDKRIKNPSPTWSGSGWQGTWTWDITASAGTGGGTLPNAIITVWGTEGASSCNMNTGNKTVSLSTWNTAPTWTSDDANIDNIKSHSIISENTNAVTVHFPTVSDREGGALYYYVYRYVNGQQVATVSEGTTARSVVDHIGGYGQGDEIKYQVRVRDSEWAWASEDRWTWAYTKNTLSGGYLNSADVRYDTEYVDISFDSASNSNGNGELTTRIYGDIHIYNAQVYNSSLRLTVWRTGDATPNNPYIKFDDIIAHVSQEGYTGSMGMRLETSNIYGSKHNSWATLRFNMITPPNNVAVTPYNAIACAGGHYYIPDKQVVKLSWEESRCSLGTPLTYTIQRSINWGSWVNIHTGLSQSTLSCDIPNYPVNEKTNCRFKVIAISQVSESHSQSGDIDLHYYNAPSISVTNENRSVNGLTAQVTTRANSSIVAIAVRDRSFTDLSGNTTPFASDNYDMTVTGLTEEQTGNVVISATDNSGLSGSTTTYNLAISSYIPIVSIRKAGLGISAFATEWHKFVVKGKALIEGVFDVVGRVWINGGLEVTGTTDVNTLNVEGVTTHTGTTHCNEFLECNSALYANSNSEFNGNVAITGRTISGTGFEVNTTSYFDSTLGQCAGQITNYDTTLTEGEYWVGTENPTGAPYGGWNFGKLIVKVNDGRTHNNSNNWIWQHFMDTSGGSFKRNKTNGGGWSSWIAVDPQLTTSELWTGVQYMNGGQTASPSKKLSECKNGWILCWSDYDPASGSHNNYNFAYSYIHKNAPYLEYNNCWDVPTGEGYNVTIAKGLKIHDTYIEGHSTNVNGEWMQDVVLREIKEW